MVNSTNSISLYGPLFAIETSFRHQTLYNLYDNEYHYINRELVNSLGSLFFQMNGFQIISSNNDILRRFVIIRLNHFSFMFTDCQES